jgi:chromosomal replication initiator protein
VSSLSAARALVFDERFRFDTFVVGPATREAVDAARVVAESPGSRWNPLIVRGGAGLGKSHLLGAVASRVRELHPGRRVVALSAAEHVPANAGDAAVVLVDDVRAGLDATRAAALRALVDAALAAGAQVVIAEEGSAISREEASAWVAHSPRARLVRLGAPDGEVRHAIVRQAAAARSLSIAPDVLAGVAHEPVSSVRELLGRLGRVGTAAEPVRDASAFSFGDDGDFASFLEEVTREVAAYAEPWRVRLGEAAGRWRAEGYEVEVLERALRLAAAPDVDALLGTFAQAVGRLKALACDAAAHDAARADDAVFRDPARIAEATTLVAALANEAAERDEAVRAAAERAVRRATPAPNAIPDVTPEGWVIEWPDVRDLLVEAWR